MNKVQDETGGGYELPPIKGVTPKVRSPKADETLENTTQMGNLTAKGALIPGGPDDFDNASLTPDLTRKKKRPVAVKHQPEAVLKAVRKITGEYDEEALERERGKSRFTGQESMGFCELAHKTENFCDRCTLYWAMILTFLFGTTMPLTFFILKFLVSDLGRSAATTQPLPEGVEKDQTPSAINSLRFMSGIQLALAGASFFLSMLSRSLFNSFADRLSYQTRIKYLESCLRQDAAYYDEHSPTEMPSKIAEEAEKIKAGMGDKSQMFYQFVATGIAGFALAFYQGWMLTLIYGVFCPLLIWANRWFSANIIASFVANMKSYSQCAGYAEQALQGIKVVQTYGTEKLEGDNYSKYLDRSREAKAYAGRVIGRGAAQNNILIFLYYAYALMLGAVVKIYDVTNHVTGKPFTGSDILGVFMNVHIANMAFTIYTHLAKPVEAAAVAGKMAYNVIENVPDVDPDAPGKCFERKAMKGKIEFRNVNFSYPTRPELQILKDFSCVMEPGKTTALVGPSGSGKSTIIQMIERFYNPESGEIFIDGKEVKSLDLRTLRRAIGYVGQEPVLFNTTIEENMKFAKPDATRKEILDALEKANCMVFIKKLKDGIQTNCGASGGQLSGGQKQRIAIARAFLKKPKILLLDEATSALDKISEQKVQQAIENYRKHVEDITIVVIAHRLSTIKSADQILVIKDGVKTEVGNHETLLRDYPDGIYSGFVAMQASAEETKSNQLDVPNTEDLTADEAQIVRKRTRQKTDDKGQLYEYVMSPEEFEMMEDAEANDDEKKKKLEELLEERNKISAFDRVMEFNDYKHLLYSGIFACILVGSGMPIYGTQFSAAMNLLMLDFDQVEKVFDTKAQGLSGRDYVMKEMLRIMGIIIVLAFTTAAGFWIRFYSFETMGAMITEKIREFLYRNILRKHMGFFDSRENATSVLTMTISEETEKINDVATNSISPLASGAAAIVISMAIAFPIQWQMALAGAILLPFIVGSMYLQMQLVMNGFKLSDELLKESNLLLGDAIGNFKTVQSFGYESLVVEKYEELMKPAQDALFWTSIKVGLVFGFSQFILTGMYAAFFYAASFVIAEPDADVGRVMTALFVMMYGGQKAGESLGFGLDIGKGVAAAKKVFTILDTPSEIDCLGHREDTSGKLKNCDNIQGHIEFRNVWFRYPTRKEEFVLKGLNLEIQPKESVALVGESGCGKSTFVNLMMRFYDPDFGEILLDGVNLKEYNLYELRKKVSLVMQEPIIFNYTITDNLLYSKLESSNDEVYEAAEIANCIDFIEHTKDREAATLIEKESAKKLKELMTFYKDYMIKQLGEKEYQEQLDILDKLYAVEAAKGGFTTEGDVDNRSEALKGDPLHAGFETMCGLKGGKLSGGQKQRVAIARTIMRKPAILMLDEATSALDEDSQKKVQGALDNAMKDRTVIIIAHRMSTIEKCDKIFVLEMGKLSESGGFNELKEKGGLFSKLTANKKE